MTDYIYKMIEGPLVLYSLSSIDNKPIRLSDFARGEIDFSDWIKDAEVYVGEKTNGIGWIQMQRSD